MGSLTEATIPWHLYMRAHGLIPVMHHQPKLRASKADKRVTEALPVPRTTFAIQHVFWNDGWLAQSSSKHVYV
jgi:hypothetical protein